MQTHYSPEFPLGFNSNPRSPEILSYLSWDELAEITRTGIYTDTDGKRYTMADAKEHRPVVTTKGNFGNRRCNDNFTGIRSPYVAVDIDIEQSASGLNKYNLTEEQSEKVNSDMDVMLDYLTGHKRDFFFCKRSGSGCGLHIVIKLEGVPDDKVPFYEREIIFQFNKALKEMGGLYYEYMADPAMMKLSQPLGLNKDENVIYNPDRVTPAATYTPTLEYGEESDGIEVSYGQRQPHRLDRLNFKRFSAFCIKEHKRLEYDDIFRLSILFMMLWPDAKVEQYIDMCSGLNEYRAKEKGENNMKFLSNEYKKVKKTVSKSYNGSVLGMNSLYYIMDKYGYTYKPDMELRFTGYLKDIEKEITEIFNTHKKVLLEAPTGTGKTVTLFNYLKGDARTRPLKNHVLALPYISMLGQFSKDHSDSEFQIGILSGDEKADREFQKIKKKQKKKPKKKKPSPLKLVEVVQGNLFEDAKKVLGEKRSNLWCSTYDSAIRIGNVQTLVIDESHNLVAQIEFRPDAMEALANVRCRKRIMISATPEILLPETLEDVYYVRCIKENAVKPKLKIERVKGSLAVAAKNHIVGKSSSLTFWNHKQECERLANILLTEGISVDCYNRDTSRQVHQKKLQQEGIITDHSLATCFISEGVNVLNDNVETINIVDDYNITNIRQAAARPRKCVPEINLILRETNYEPGVWVFSPVKIYIAELARLELIADKLNELREKLGGGDENLFAAFKDDEDFIYFDKNRHWFMVRENRVKASIMERYQHWLYHKRRELWRAELSKSFDIVEDKVTDNTGKNERKTEQPFEVFKATSHELILAFRAHKMKTADRRRRKKEPYTPEMTEWAAAHNHLELTPEWERWTDRYVKMWEYQAIDYGTIKSGPKFCHWERRADMFVSVREDGDTAKDVRIAETNKEVITFLLSQDYSASDIDTLLLYQMVKSHIKSKKLKTIVLKKRPFWASLKHLLKIELRQKKSTGKRYVRSISLINGDVPYTTGKLERLEQDIAKAEEREAIDKFLGVGTMT